jgi:hypothetical protein
MDTRSPVVWFKVRVSKRKDGTEETVPVSCFENLLIAIQREGYSLYY